MAAVPEEYLPLSMLNQLIYCERRFYLMHVLGEMEINAHVLEGVYRHEQAHSGVRQQAGEKATHRRVYVWSDQFQIAGFTDLVEISPGTEPGEAASIQPIEYKKGRMGRWLNDSIQLCAQALCLEERLGVPIEKGGVFYFGSRRRQEVVFDAALRQRTYAAIQRARALIEAHRLPPPLSQEAKCRDCSLEPVCVPEIRKLTFLEEVRNQ